MSDSDNDVPLGAYMSEDSGDENNPPPLSTTQPPTMRLPKRTRDEAYESRTTHAQIQRDVWVKPVHDAEWITFENSKRVLLFAYIAMFTLEYALKEVKKPTPRINVNTATDEELFERLKHMDQLFDPNLVGFFRDQAKRVLFQTNGCTLFCIPELGEILNERGFLLGSCEFSKVRVMLNGKHYMRSQLVLQACKKEKSSEDMTSDHINNMLPSNDSISNLRWASPVTQVANRTFSNRVPCSALEVHATNLKTGTTHIVPSICSLPNLVGFIPHVSLDKPIICKKGWAIQVVLPPMDGLILPTHFFFRNLQLSNTGYYKLGSSMWRQQNIPYPRIITGERQHILMLESILGRKLGNKELCDHVSGDTINNHLSNLWPVSPSINSIKKDQQMRVGKDNVGNLKLYLSSKDASACTGTHRPNICLGIKGVFKRIGGFEWRYASIAELNKIFELINIHISPLEWSERIAMLEDYKDDALYEKMRTQAILSMEYAKKLKAWEDTVLPSS